MSTKVKESQKTKSAVKTKVNNAEPKAKQVKNDDNQLAEKPTENTTKQTMKFETQLTGLQEQFKEASQLMKNLSSQMKKLEAAYKHDIKLASSKKHKRHGSYVATGFAKPIEVPAPLANFIGVKPNTLLTGPQVTKEVWKQMRERDLVCDDDGRKFKLNSEVKKLFSIPDSVTLSKEYNDKSGFNFRTLQTYISKALGRDVKKTGSEKDVTEETKETKPTKVSKAKTQTSVVKKK